MKISTYEAILRCWNRSKWSPEEKMAAPKLNPADSPEADAYTIKPNEIELILFKDFIWFELIH